MLPKTIPDQLPGTVLPQYVRCGKPNCKCARGELHGPYWYRFWRADGYTLHKEYVRKADVEAVRAACARYQQEVQEGRRLIRRARRLFAWLAETDDESIRPAWYVRNQVEVHTVAHQLVEYGEGEHRSVRQLARIMDVLGLLQFPGKRQTPRDYSWLLMGEEWPNE